MRKSIVVLILMLCPGALWAVKEYPTGATHLVSFFSHVPTFRFGYARQARIKFNGPTRYRPKWTYATGKEIFSSPVIDRHGHVIFGSRDDHLYCLDKDGALVWKFKADDDIDSTVTIGKDGTIYFGSDDKHFYALTASGRLKWKVKTSGEIRSSALVLPGGLVVVPNYDGYLLGIKNGQILWSRYLSGGWCNAAPAYNPDDKMIYVVNNRASLFAVDTSGNIKWSQYVTGYGYNGKVQNGTVVIDDNGNLFFSSRSGVYSYTSKGKQRWHLSSIQTYIAPSLTQTGDLVVVDTKGTLHKISESGKILYSKKVSGRETYSSILVDAKDRMYFGSRDDKFYALDSAGNELFSILVGKDVESSPTISPTGVIYFGTDWGKLHAIR